MKRLKVGVIFGGRSVEHDVSVITAHQVMAQLAERHEIVPIYIDRDGRWFTGSALNDLDVYRTGRYAEVGEEGVVSPAAGGRGLTLAGGRLRGARTVDLDVVIPAVHGTYGEDGTLQGLLELADLPYTGSGVVASAVGMDKVAMKAAFSAAGLPVVPGVVIDEQHLSADAQAVAQGIESELDYPLFVKPSKLGSSVGIAKASDRTELLESLDVARRYDTRVLVERAMEGCLEINCAVLGGMGTEPRASVCEQPVGWEEFLSFSDKYLRGGKTKSEGMASLERRIPAPISEQLTKQVQENALQAFAAVSASGTARVDSFVDESSGQTWVMEINTVPGSFAFYLWEESGLSFGDLLDELIAIALRTHERKKDLMFTFDSDLLSHAPRGKTGG
ncbi:MAG TPA: D-alanine--D-alanine ligase family protein [Actinomycetota bacterium]|nr:D-alanine--D-alanine ligase family protein [Actinomycetota bacterium]